MTDQLDRIHHVGTKWRSLRLPGYDYRQPGAYFITICTHQRACLFGTVQDHQLHSNEAGQAMEAIWQSLPERFPHVAVDAFIAMPSHVHGILFIQDEANPRPLGSIVGAYKSLTTRAYGEGVRMQGWEPFAGRLWQPNYFEHIIRSEVALNRIRQYIADNPLQWDKDPENPYLERREGVVQVERCEVRGEALAEKGAVGWATGTHNWHP